MRWQAGAKGVKGVKVTVQRIVISITFDCSWPKLYISNQESWFFAFCPELFHIHVPTRLLSFGVQAAACNKFRTRTWTPILISGFSCSWPTLPEVTTLDHILFGFPMLKPGTFSAEATFKPCSKWIYSSLYIEIPKCWDSHREEIVPLPFVEPNQARIEPKSTGKYTNRSQDGKSSVWLTVRSHRSCCGLTEAILAKNILKKTLPYTAILTLPLVYPKKMNTHNGLHTSSLECLFFVTLLSNVVGTTCTRARRGPSKCLRTWTQHDLSNL